MATATLWFACPACRSPKSVGLANEQSETSCIACRHTVTGLLFPRALAPASPPPLPVAAPIPGDAVCFYDPARKATGLCDQCGVLVSDDWSAHWGNRKICLRCLEKLRESGRDSRFESSRLMWDNICLLLSLAVLNPFVPYVAAITAPLALILGLRAWKRPRSLVHRSRFRLVVALVFSLLQIIGMIAGIVGIIYLIMSVQND